MNLTASMRYCATWIGVEWQLSRRMPWKRRPACSQYSFMYCHSHGLSSGSIPYLTKSTTISNEVCGTSASRCHPR